MVMKGKVLLVDDEPLVLEMFEDALSKEGYDVAVAASAKEAVSQLDRCFFDVLICDVLLEGLDGFDVLQIARKKSENIGVILITGAPSESDNQRATDLKVEYLSKPIGLEQMVDCVENVAPDHA